MKEHSNWKQVIYHNHYNSIKFDLCINCFIFPLITVYGCNQTVGCSRTVACNRTVTLTNHINCSQLNPPITEVITITIATITYPKKLGINPKWMNMQHLGSVSTRDMFPLILDIWYEQMLFHQKGMHLFSWKL